MPTRMPMFPLGTPLLPGSILPLHVFEPRYRQMIADCLAGDGEFGVPLITRGREVGGGDERAMVAAVARIARHETYADGRMGLIAVGTRRVRVVEWLPDDPYPMAAVEEHPDTDEDTAAGDETTMRFLGACHAQTRRVLAMASELGESVPDPETEIASEPGLAAYHLASMAPLGPLDRLRVLSAPSVRERFAVLAQCLEDAEAMLRFRLGAPPP